MRCGVGLPDRRWTVLAVSGERARPWMLSAPPPLDRVGRSNLREMLTEQAAIEIYKYKLALIDNTKSDPKDAYIRHVSVRGRSAPLSKLYGVSARTIRDIWNRQTWGYATSPLWHQEDAMTHMEHMSTSSSIQVGTTFFIFAFRCG